MKNLKYIRKIFYFNKCFSKLLGNFGFFLLLIESAYALDITKKDSVVYLSGFIVSGDQYKFKEFMDEKNNQDIKIIYLNSGGGRIADAREIGRYIRKNGISTLTDAKTMNCASACTFLFGSGINRYYINGNIIKDGLYERSALKTGLGFHEANTPVGMSGKKEYNGIGSAEAINIYYEFGINKAKDLMLLAPFDKFYRISGDTALKLGIATSLKYP